MGQSNSNLDLDVIIIGGGWSGLLACKYCLAEGLKTLVVESRETIGGVWAYTSNPRFGGVMRTTQMTSSRCITEISDFPMPATYPDFPVHADILAYLKSYCVRFRLDDHIRLGCHVKTAKKIESVWCVTCTDGSEYRATNVIVTSGVHQHPNDVSGDRRFRPFTGQIQHSAAIKETPSDYAGKTIIVWGGGESASDIALEASKVAAHVYWCIPNGQWFVPKVVERWPPFPSGGRKVVDHTSSRLRLFLSPTHRYSPFISQFLEHTFGFNGHGQEPWKTEAPYNRSFFNKSSEVLSMVKSGNVIPKRDIAHCDGQNVCFDDGLVARTDVIITCSGYRAVFPFFDGPAAPAADPRIWYKYLFDNNDPSLAFVGFVRPIFGSIPGIAELQSRYVALVFAGRRSLPPAEERKRIIRPDAEFWNHHFRYTSLRLRGLVDHFLYSKALAKLIGCAPRFWKLLFTSPRKWWIAISSPWNGCQFWLNDESQHERIFQTFARYRDNQMSEVYAFLVLAPILPLIGLFTQVSIVVKERLLKKVPNAIEPCPADCGLPGAVGSLSKEILTARPHAEDPVA
jgi:dimethylaniline monooxygenase (N-oxide forming)